MKLNALDREAFVTDGHDDAVFGPRSRRQIGGQFLLIDDERMITHGREGVLEIAEDRLRVMAYLRKLPVHDLGRAHDLAAEGGADALMSQTDAQNRSVGAEFPYHIA